MIKHAPSLHIANGIYGIPDTLHVNIGCFVAGSIHLPISFYHPEKISSTLYTLLHIQDEQTIIGHVCNGMHKCP